MMSSCLHDSLVDFDLIDFSCEMDNPLGELSSNISISSPSDRTTESDSTDSVSAGPSECGSSEVAKKRTLQSPLQSAIVYGTNEPVKKKKKRYYVPVFTLPRILKRDIRRDYGSMFANVLNSTDFTMMNNFFATFVTHDCAFVENCYDSAAALQANSPLFKNTTVGQREIVNYLYTIVSNFPDFMVKINSNRIIQKSGMTGSIIVFSASMKGTKVDSPEMLLALARNDVLPLPLSIPNHLKDILADPAAAMSNILQVNAWEKTFKQLLPDIAQSPTIDSLTMANLPFLAATSAQPNVHSMKDVGCDSVLTFYLNEQNLIYKIEGRDSV